MTKNRLSDSSGASLRTRLCLLVLAAVSACQGGGTVGVKSGDGGPNDAPFIAVDSVVVRFPDGGVTSSVDGTCLALTSCKVAGGQYCGYIGDRCGGGISCGACPAGQTCVGSVCNSGGGYDGGLLTSCTVTGGQYCGDIGNGVGGKLACGDCTTPGWSCTDGLCTAPATVCTPTACQTGSGHYCGTIGDGCGHGEDCGTCATGQACVNNQCVPATGCVPATCNPTGGQYCGGLVGDGCGGEFWKS